MDSVVNEMNFVVDRGAPPTVGVVVVEARREGDETATGSGACPVPPPM